MYFSLYSEYQFMLLEVFATIVYYSNHVGDDEEKETKMNKNIIFKLLTDNKFECC